MNISDARKSLEELCLSACMDIGSNPIPHYDTVKQFINEVEALLKHNSIKQTPALFKEKK